MCLVPVPEVLRPERFDFLGLKPPYVASVRLELSTQGIPLPCPSFQDFVLGQNFSSGHAVILKSLSIFSTFKPSSDRLLLLSASCLGHGQKPGVAQEGIRAGGQQLREYSLDIGSLIQK